MNEEDTESAGGGEPLVLPGPRRGPGARPPNGRLESLIVESGSSHAGLARRVNELGAEQGLRLRYDKTSVARWIAGQHPRVPVPGLVAEVLTRKLGRQVTPHDIGMTSGGVPFSGVGLDFAPTLAQTLDQCAELWRGDVNRRGFLYGASFASSASVQPSRDWLVSAPDAVVERSGSRRVGASDVEAIEATADVFRGLDNRFGGGHARHAIVHYLDGDVAERLGGSYNDRVGRELFRASARLTLLAGWTAYDTGHQGLAQRYFIQALRLATASGDRLLGGYLLMAMSRQATFLGNGREAYQLARAAREGNRDHLPPRVSAFFHAVEARALGTLGDARACASALARAESDLGRASPGDDEPSWAAFYDEAQLCDEFAHAFRDLGRAGEAVPFAERSLRLRGEGYARSRMFCQTVLATSHASLGDVEQACAVGNEAVEGASRLRSVRSLQYVRDLRHALAPYADVPAVRELDARAGVVLAMAPPG